MRGAAFAGQELVEREAQVGDPRDRLALLRGLLQPAGEREEVAAPELVVAAHVLHMQARVALLGPVTAEVAVTGARTADAVREHDQRHRRAAGRGLGPVQPHRHEAVAGAVVPVEVEGLEAVELALIGGDDRRRRRASAASRSVALAQAPSNKAAEATATASVAG